MPQFGTLTSLDDLQDNGQTIAEFGEENLAERVQTAFEIHNETLQEHLDDFAVITAAAQLPYGNGDDMEFGPLDEFGSPDAQKITAAGSVGLPLEFYGRAVQWNRIYMRKTTVAAHLARLDAAAGADVRNLIRQIRRAFLVPTNRLNYRDKRATDLTYHIRALLNGDGTPIPLGPNGETFDGATHTHYTAEAALTEAGLTAAVENVIEHGVAGGVVIYINRAQEEAVRGFDRFTPYVEQRVRPALTERVAEGTLDETDPTDRAIGLFLGAEVWVKPWVPANYQIVFDRGAGSDKPIGIRTVSGTLAGENGGLTTLYEDDDFPLRARAVGREFGTGAVARHKAAVHHSGGAIYTAPAITI